MILVKRTLKEVKVRLKREPSIREIYVEGMFDRDLFRWVLDQLNLKDIRVYPISVLDIPSDLLAAMGLSSGERQRVQAAAREFEDEAALHKQLLFIMDADLDYLLGTANYSAPLLATDGTCAEMILWRKDVLQKFFTMGFGCENAERLAEELLSYVEPIATALCVFRAAKQQLGADWKLIDAEDTFDRKTPFSFDEYCKKIANKNGAHNVMREEFPKALAEILERAGNLPSIRKLHGHDTFAVLAKMLRIRGFNQHCLKDSNELSRIVMASLEWSLVNTNETIRQVHERFSTPGPVSTTSTGEAKIL